jgi:hypothetical protein
MVKMYSESILLQLAQVPELKTKVTFWYSALRNHVWEVVMTSDRNILLPKMRQYVSPKCWQLTYRTEWSNKLEQHWRDKSGNVRNVKVTHVCATVVVEKQWVLHNLSVCICSLSYPACDAHAPYCHLRPEWLYYIFLNYLTNGTIFKKKLLNTKCVFWFLLQLLSETFLNPRRTERDMIKNVYRSSCTVPVILVRF